MKGRNAMSNMTFKQWALDSGEKAGSTLVQSIIVFFSASVAWDSNSWKALLAACVPALFSVVKSSLTTWIPHPKNTLADIAVRAFWTFAVSLTGAMAVGGLDLFDMNNNKKLVIAAATTALSILKGGIAAKVSDTVTPASLLSSTQYAAAG
jgi:hypothetical protein